MTTPFADFANATLYFRVASGTLEENPETGNVQPQFKIIKATAMLQVSSGTRSFNSDGVPTGQVSLKGYWVNPSFRHPRIDTLEIAAIIWDGKQGEFTLAESGKSPFFNEAESTGEKIEGIFKPGSLPFPIK